MSRTALPTFRGPAVHAVDVARDLRLQALATRRSRRAQAAADLLLALALGLAGAAALILWLLPCDPAAALCTIVPLAPYRRRGTTGAPAAAAAAHPQRPAWRRWLLRWQRRQLVQRQALVALRVRESFQAAAVLHHHAAEDSLHYQILAIRIAAIDLQLADPPASTPASTPPTAA